VATKSITVQIPENLYDLLDKASELADIPISRIAENFIRLGINETAKACRDVINLEHLPE